MNAAPDRRAVLGSILTAGACLSVPSWAGAGALVAYPLLAAIERHRRAYDAFMDAWGQTNVSRERGGPSGCPPTRGGRSGRASGVPRA
jgi:lipase chaperone LimK